MKRNYKKLCLIGIPAAAAVIALIMLVTGTFSGYSPVKVYASNLMEGITPQKVEPISPNNNFYRSTADFSIDLFKNSYTKGKNSLISPTSVYLALGMTANGADGSTLKEFEGLLGKYGLNLNDLNKYYYTMNKSMTQVESGRVSIANSIWYRQDIGLDVSREFLQTNADYYGAAAYKADFNSTRTVKDMNGWVKNNTEGYIDKIIDKINPNTVMYLINALYFEDEWKNIYTKDEVEEGKFQIMNSKTISAQFMNSIESVYLQDEKSEGFVKPYKNGQYSFVSLLPKEGEDIDSYIASLTGDNFINVIKNKSQNAVIVSIPKFQAEYKVELKEPLEKMGLKTCFDPKKADFTKMEGTTNNDLYVGEVTHKAAITVDERGTKAGAATAVEMDAMGTTAKSIIFNRPFVYAIVDNDTDLPLFIGTMMNPKE
ncbi:MAG: serpin family protein [Bacillota bacterium]|nr:serpin family protein [Bacillota bacterium]